MPWVTENGQWVDLSGGLTAIAWAFDGDTVKVSTTNPTSNYSYIVHTPRIMNVLAGTAKTQIKIKDGTEAAPKPGCYSTDIWEYFQYNYNRGAFSQIKGYWRSPEHRGRSRMSVLDKGIRR
tara:strand:+ start:7544 stop:7906 length:363 start_codon:yes stop_codon:yes gene_type:complete